MTICGTQSLKYLPAGTFQKKFADLCSVLFQNILFSRCCHNPTPSLALLIQLLVHVPLDLGSRGSIPHPAAWTEHKCQEMNAPCQQSSLVDKHPLSCEEPTHWKRSDSLEKTLMLGKTKGRRRKGQQWIRWLDGIPDSVDMHLSKLGNS